MQSNKPIVDKSKLSLVISYLTLRKMIGLLGFAFPVFWLESVSLFAFGISWLVKGQLILKDIIR